MILVDDYMALYYRIKFSCLYIPHGHYFSILVYQIYKAIFLEKTNPEKHTIVLHIYLREIKIEITVLRNNNFKVLIFITLKRSVFMKCLFNLRYFGFNFSTF